MRSKWKSWNQDESLLKISHSSGNFFSIICWSMSLFSLHWHLCLFYLWTYTYTYKYEHKYLLWYSIHIHLTIIKRMWNFEEEKNLNIIEAHFLPKSGSKRIQIRIRVSNPDPERENQDPSGSGSDTLKKMSIKTKKLRYLYKIPVLKL